MHVIATSGKAKLTSPYLPPDVDCKGSGVSLGSALRIQLRTLEGSVLFFWKGRNSDIWSFGFFVVFVDHKDFIVSH